MAAVRSRLLHRLLSAPAPIRVTHAQETLYQKFTPNRTHLYSVQVSSTRFLYKLSNEHVSPIYLGNSELITAICALLKTI